MGGMNNMEYKVISLAKDVKGIEAQLKQEGNSDWELITIIHQPLTNAPKDLSPYVAYFKKPSS
jgi:hypothetical protein